jgi:hypothetical protein
MIGPSPSALPTCRTSTNASRWSWDAWETFQGLFWPRMARRSLRLVQNPAFRVDQSPLLHFAGHIVVMDLLDGGLSGHRRPQDAPHGAGAISAASLRLAAAAPCGRVGAFLTPSAVHASVAGLVRRRGLSYQLREFLRPPLGAQNESFSPQTALNALTYAVFSAAADCAGPLEDDARRSDTPERSTSRATTPKSHMAKI